MIMYSYMIGLGYRWLRGWIYWSCRGGIHYWVDWHELGVRFRGFWL